MLTKTEITSLNLSPTKKDFVQIWNELLEVAGKLSERWDPTSTNESDPGIVLLKALTGIADKLNYNIDKNTLEAFMPTAAQEDSMRKLCDMLGYSMKYYRSAEAEVLIKYYNADPSTEETAQMDLGLYIPKFTVITNNDKDISYFTLDTVRDNYYISKNKPSVLVPCMEGQIVKCESLNTNNVITINQISNGNRYYLPETQVAENGIFIYNVQSIASSQDALLDGEKWVRVDNLNTQVHGSRVFKFCFDSYESRPYIEFPDDYSELFGEGLFIYYTRTSGSNGNISIKTLTQLELPSASGWDKVSTESFSVENISATNSGANLETINQAYSNFKKTIGTFETLVTCRDYMNKIYAMTVSGKPLVSNIRVTDIRDDINRATTLCSCDGAGILYREVPFFTTITTEPSAQIADSDKQAIITERIQAIDNFDLVLYPFKSYTPITSNSQSYVKNIKDFYDASFALVPNNKCNTEIVGALKDDESCRTIAHNFKNPRTKTDIGSIGDIISINNYLRLNATIATNNKVTTDEGATIIDNIKIALANAFNMRELDFGEEIPFDSIIDVIEKADPRIRVAALNEPELYTTYSVLESIVDGAPVVVEYAVDSDWLNSDQAEKIKCLTHFVDPITKKETTSGFNTDTAKKLHNKLAVRNVLAGRVPLFNYNNTFKTSFYENAYQVTEELDGKKVPEDMPEPSEDSPVVLFTDTAGAIYTGYVDKDGNTAYNKTATPDVYKDGLISEKPGTDGYIIDELEANMKLKIDSATGAVKDVTLANGEFIRFRAPNFITTKTYPAYVNYRLDLVDATQTAAKAAKAESLYELLTVKNPDGILEAVTARWDAVFNHFSSEPLSTMKKSFTLSQTFSPASDSDAPPSTSSIDLKLLNQQVASPEQSSVEELINLCSCVRITKAEATWIGNVPDDDDEKKKLEALQPSNYTDLYLLSSSTIYNIMKKVDEILAKAVTDKKLPTANSWKISFEFEGIPFTASTLDAWESFIAKAADTNTLGFTPQHEHNKYLWRKFGEGYEIGKYVTEDTGKLLKFTAGYFGLLPSVPLQGIYIVEEFGIDEVPVRIKNNDEYCLKDGEYLYIEYTPSTTTDEGTTKNLAAVTEVYGHGTIIRPNGFEAGLTDSDDLNATSPKPVTFVMPDGNLKQVELFSFSANEQVEIRDFAKVELSKNTLKTTSGVYIYKNFVCDKLEKAPTDSKSRAYTLKDGEYIFYTDKNKSELAYYTKGTQVRLEGKAIIPEAETVELADIFEYGIQAIPSWYYQELLGDNKIIFEEFQYITLGADDTIKDLELNSKTDVLDDTWQYCNNAVYTVASDKNTLVELPTLTNISGRDGNGWEVCSILELDVSNSASQVLRNTDNIETNLKLRCVNSTGGVMDEPTISPEAGTSLHFMTNLACQAYGNKININDIYYNPNKLSSFQLKVFMEDAPVIVKTAPNKLVPSDSSITDFTQWHGTPILKKDYSDLWEKVELAALRPVPGKSEGEAGYDNALRLPINLLPNTYCVFCIYLDYTSSTFGSTWIEMLTGTSEDTVALFNYPDRKLTDNKLSLSPGINCVRVNRNCKLFIKTSTDSTGILYFDEPRLVSIDKDEQTQNSTYGLNLEQLGYFATNKSDTKISEQESDAQSIKRTVAETKKLEEALLDDIRGVDVNNYFYYNVPIEDHMAIELNERDSKLNTLLNPATYYDANNVNNKFVISKLDIDYLDGGIQIARSSRLK